MEKIYYSVQQAMHYIIVISAYKKATHLKKYNFGRFTIAIKQNKTKKKANIWCLQPPPPMYYFPSSNFTLWRKNPLFTAFCQVKRVGHWQIPRRRALKFTGHPLCVFLHCEHYPCSQSMFSNFSIIWE